MTDVRATTESFLAEKPDAEDTLEELLALDAEHETWTFDDASVGSGRFGELVSRDIVEACGDEYRIRDRDAVVQALGSTDDIEANDESSRTRSMPSVSVSRLVQQIDRVAAAGLVGSLTLVVLFRMLPFQSVFQQGDVVLSGNDPYAYRYFVHQLLAESSNAFDISVLSSLPLEISHAQPLFVSTLWWVSALFGGGDAAGYVLAWYPVVSALVTALLVYLLAVRVTDDKRVGISAVALLGIIPAHAFRTGLGFADHHAFDYPWLALTVLALVTLVDRESWDKSTWLWALALGIGVGGQTLAWDAGPLLLVPVAVAIAAIVPSELRAGRNLITTGLPIIAGLTVSAVLASGAHIALGWHSLEVVIVPGLLLGGAIGVFTLGELVRRFDAPIRAVIGIEAVAGIGGLFGVRTLAPTLAEQFTSGFTFLVATDSAAETASLVSSDYGSIVAPILLFGFAILLALPYIGWASWLSYRRHSPAWMVGSVYGWYFFALAILQMRFAGQLALFVALFGGLGFVHVAAWIDITTYPLPFQSEQPGVAYTGDQASETKRPKLESPSRRTALYTAGLGLGVGSFGMFMIPIEHRQLSADRSMYQAARFMRAYADERGLAYPESYVFSNWGHNRMYNWFVNGESEEYAFAFNNFEEFLTSTDSQEWYDRLRDRVGFVVVTDQHRIDTGGQTNYENLQGETFGIETGRFQAIWASEDDTVRVYRPVPGARITGETEQGSLMVECECDIDGQPQSISITHSTGGDGPYEIRVPLPGTYTIDGTTVTVSDSDVETGAQLNIDAS
jgi:dolichyl-diphosphooligosaccharide--protein glycosyltransferase